MPMQMRPGWNKWPGRIKRVLKSLRKGLAHRFVPLRSDSLLAPRLRRNPVDSLQASRKLLEQSGRNLGEVHVAATSSQEVKSTPVKTGVAAGPTAAEPLEPELPGFILLPTISAGTIPKNKVVPPAEKKEGGKDPGKRRRAGRKEG